MESLWSDSSQSANRTTPPREGAPTDESNFKPSAISDWAARGGGGAGGGAGCGAWWQGHRCRADGGLLLAVAAMGLCRG
jgi:hypothetical protein